MNILSCAGDDNLATVMTASFDDGTSKLIEFVDAKDPDLPLAEKWVLIVSTQFGCPIGCRMCDAGSYFEGNLTAEQIFAQIDHIVKRRQDNVKITSKKFKVQFARMGEPALNPAVLDVLRELPQRYDAPGLMPCIATTMPRGSERWFDELLEIKRSAYTGCLVQLQASINTTDEKMRDHLMPYPKWSFEEIAAYGTHFVDPDSRKMSLNFALTKDYPVDADVIARNFDPEHFCIKITPLNPTIAATEGNLASAIDPYEPGTAQKLCDEFSRRGFETILSIGDPRENEIGSNCGMSVRKLRR